MSKAAACSELQCVGLDWGWQCHCEIDVLVFLGRRWWWGGVTCMWLMTPFATEFTNSLG